MTDKSKIGVVDLNENVDGWEDPKSKGRVSRRDNKQPQPNPKLAPQQQQGQNTATRRPFPSFGSSIPSPAARKIGEHQEDPCKRCSILHSSCSRSRSRTMHWEASRKIPSQRRTGNQQRATRIAPDQPFRGTGRIQTASVPELESGTTVGDGSRVPIGTNVSPKDSALRDSNEAEPIAGTVDKTIVRPLFVPRRVRSLAFKLGIKV